MSSLYDGDSFFIDVWLTDEQAASIISKLEAANNETAALDKVYCPTSSEIGLTTGTFIPCMVDYYYAYAEYKGFKSSLSFPLYVCLDAGYWKDTSTLSLQGIISLDPGNKDFSITGTTYPVSMGSGASWLCLISITKLN